MEHLHFRAIGFQSTHSLRSATQKGNKTMSNQIVSIHALLAECDSHLCPQLLGVRGFNPRTPCGVRPMGRACEDDLAKFQSTHSLRSATLSLYIGTGNRGFQSTHSLRSATGIGNRPACLSLFQSTHSLRSATGQDSQAGKYVPVSIHALLAECDLL